VVSDPNPQLQQLVTKAKAELVGTHAQDLGETIAQLTADIATLEERLHKEQELALAIKQKSHQLYGQLASIPDVPAVELWGALSTLLELYGTYPINQLNRLRTGIFALLQLPIGTPIVCSGREALYPGDGWFGTQLAERPRLDWRGGEWRLVLTGPPSQAFSRFRHILHFGLVGRLGADSALRRDKVLVGPRLIRGYVGEVKTAPDFRTNAEKIRRALLYAGLDKGTIREILG
jgi:hypothetical protein